MFPAFDLNLFPIYRVKGQDWPQFPGLLAGMPPKRTARGREDDRLVIHLAFSSNTLISAREYSQTALQMSQRFYETGGSLTSAIRTVAEALNQSLVDRNLRTTGKGQYIIGRLIMGVLRGPQFIFAQCGPTSVLHLTGGEVRQVHDAQISGRGLGISQASPLYFAQLDLQQNDQLVLCDNLPSGWESALPAGQPLAPEDLRRNLLSIAGENLNAVLVQVLPGKGGLNVLKTLPESARAVPEDAGTDASDFLPGRSPTISLEAGISQENTASPAATSSITSRVESASPASRFARILAASAEKPAEDAEKAEGLTQERKDASPVGMTQPGITAPPPVRHSKPVSTPSRARPAAAPRGRFVSPRTNSDLPEIKRPSTRYQGLYRRLAKTLQGTRQGLQKAAEWIKKLLPNLLPGMRENGAEVSRSSLLFLAIAIPIIIVTISVLIYARYGRVTQYQENYNQALEQASQAHGQVDATEVRRAWDSTLYYLDLAEAFQTTQDSRNLRQQAQAALDNLDGIVRLEFRQAIIGGLSRSTQVSRMATTNTDLYLLDSSRGSVMRAVLGSQGYEIDPSFKCGPGEYESTPLGNLINVGNLIDIEALQMSNIYNARVMALDASGNLLYCGFNMDPLGIPLSPPPLGWQNITAFSLDSDGKNLYVLDARGNAVWVYQGEYGKFVNPPTMFFGEQVPQSMNTAIDLAANTSDLYLLFEDGHVTACAASHYEVVPLRCTDPLNFVDNRPERQPGPKITDAIFNQMSFAGAPDPLLYLLEPLTRAVYYFSPRSNSLEMRGQYRAGVEQSNNLFNGPATAMNISPNRHIFLSTGDQVFFATSMP